jgi:hypothetical protein
MAFGPIAPGKFGKGESEETSDNLYYVTLKLCCRKVTQIAEILGLAGERYSTDGGAAGM